MDRVRPGFLLDWLLAQPNLLLAGHLAILHVLTFWPGASLEVRLILWPVAMGLFLLWQPVVSGGQRLGPGQTLVLVALVCLWALFLNPWMLLLWCATLAALIAGRGLRVGSLGRRLALLLAFADLLCLMMLGLVPLLPSDPALLGLLPRDTFAMLLTPLLLCLPWLPAEREKRTGEVDFIHSLLIFLLLAVFVLGSLAVTFLHGTAYGWALFITSLSLGGGLLLLAWAWNPRAGFAGMGAAFARYLLSLGLPMEDWLRRLCEESEASQDPEQFLRAALARLLELPWIHGVAWRTAAGEGRLGQGGGGVHRFSGAGLQVELYFRQTPAPALCWHLDWLLRLLLAFYQVKCQAHQLQVLDHERAVHETGARVTHDVKNILQSLQNLCFAAAHAQDPGRLGDMIQKQLPVLADRLQGTLGRLRRPELPEEKRQMAVRAWWQALVHLHRPRGVSLACEAEVAQDEDCPGSLPAGLFDSVAANLLENAHAKARREPGLTIRVRLSRHEGGWALRVEDDGSPLDAALAQRLFREPVRSEDGLGIGLYHGARQAALAGYRLVLEVNEPGRVVFALLPGAAAPA
ncbi:sensor histidine kinase KdpD [Azovibrio restrictus]|uniref:sensor histidine kinase n=1 Tax=Azovibrio restrictus TaxID=146938 RepID=UPI0026EACA90|nr:hypothetical protein [Azovibrio restrictus]